MVTFACEAIRRAGWNSEPLAVSEPGALAVLATTHGGKDAYLIPICQEMVELLKQSINKDELDLILR